MYNKVEHLQNSQIPFPEFVINALSKLALTYTQSLERQLIQT
jgi:hypothetical protein